MLPAVLRLLALGAALLTGCDSTALSLDDPNRANVTFDPPLWTLRTNTLEVTMTLGDGDPANGTGDEQTFGVLTYDFGEGVSLQSYTFESNFQAKLVLQRYPGVEVGEHDMVLQIRNYYGTFFARGTFYVSEYVEE